MCNTVQFHNREEIEAIVRRFENCDFAKGEFTHTFHLTVAAWYRWHFPATEALERMRLGLIRLTGKFGVKAYHETITRFWIRLLDKVLNSEERGHTLTESINRIVSAYGAKDCIYEYYSRNLLLSDSAREGWVEPDLKPI